MRGNAQEPGDRNAECTDKVVVTMDSVARLWSPDRNAAHFERFEGYAVTPACERAWRRHRSAGHSPKPSYQGYQDPRKTPQARFKRIAYRLPDTTPWSISHVRNWFKRAWTRSEEAEYSYVVELEEFNVAR